MAKQSIFAYLGINTDDFQKGMGKAKTQMNSFEKAGASFAKNIGGLFAGAFAIDAIVTFGQEASDLAGKLTGVEAAFKKIDNGGLLKNLRAATKGTVSDLELMQNAVKAENLGLPVEQLGTYFEFARRTAKATGESVDFLVQSIVTGIGRKSPLILDNLGISTTQLNAQLEKTPDFATAVGVVIAEKMAKAGEDVDTAAERSAQFAAVWQNFKTGVGKGINDAISSIVQSFADLWDVLKELFAPIGELLGAFDSLNGEFSIGAMLGDLLTMSIKALTFMLKPMVWIVQKVAEGFKWLYENSEFFRQSVEIIRGSINGVIKVFGNLGAIMSAIGNSFSHLWEAIKTMNFDGLGSKISGEFKKAFETKPIEEHTKALGKNIDEVKELTAEELKAIEEKKKAAFEKKKESLNLDSLKDNKLNTPLVKASKAVGGLVAGLDEELQKMKPTTVNIPITPKLEVTDTSGIKEPLGKLVLDITDSLKEVGMLAATTFGAALGTAFAGGDLSAIGADFLKGVASIVEGIGQQMISLGIAALLAKDSLKLLFANPALAIGAGVALVAVAGAMKSLMSQSAAPFANGGLVTGPTLGLVGEGIGTNSANPEVIAPLDKLKNFINPSGGGMGGGDVQFRIEGNTLVGILNRQQKTSKFSR